MSIVFHNTFHRDIILLQNQFRSNVGYFFIRLSCNILSMCVFVVCVCFRTRWYSRSPSIPKPHSDFALFFRGNDIFCILINNKSIRTTTTTTTTRDRGRKRKGEKYEERDREREQFRGKNEGEREQWIILNLKSRSFSIIITKTRDRKWRRSTIYKQNMDFYYIYNMWHCTRSRKMRRFCFG